MTAPALENSAPVAPLSEAAMRHRQEVEAILGPGAVFEKQGALPAFRVLAADIHATASRLREAGYDYLVLVTAVDYPAEKRFELVYVLSSFADEREVALVADVSRDRPVIETVSDLWETADWHEREVYDMFGIGFDKHRDLRRILLDDNWIGYPLRKDYVDTLHDVIKRPV
jgi:NADH-quinone oxidoreductase subunit C